MNITTMRAQVVPPPIEKVIIELTLKEAKSLLHLVGCGTISPGCMDINNVKELKRVMFTMLNEQGVLAND